MAKWNIIKHEKSRYTNFIEDISNTKDVHSEYSLHHEVSPSVTEADEENVNLIFDYVDHRFNPFNLKKLKLTNIVTGEEIDGSFLLNCFTLGEERYKTYYETRLINESLTMFDIIPKVRKQSNTIINQLKVDIKKEAIKASRLIIDIARTRNYDIKKLLRYELTSTSFF